MEGATRAVDEIKTRRRRVQSATRRRRAHPLHNPAMDILHQFFTRATLGTRGFSSEDLFRQVRKRKRTYPDAIFRRSTSFTVDGLHVGRYIARIEEMLAQPEAYLD